MSFIKNVEHRYARTMQVLGLGPAAGRILHALILLDLEGADKPDVHGRQGIMSWQRMVDDVGGEHHAVAEFEDAMVALADWGLVQIVGRALNDPKLTGSSALRLTHAGRVCTGLAPHRGTTADLQLKEHGWLVLHHASREGLLVAAELGGVLMLVRVVGAHAATLYAWSPLAVVEIAGQGHTEAVVVGALLHDVGWKLSGVEGRVDSRPDAASLAARLGILETTTGDAEARARHDAVGAAYLRRAGFDDLAVRMVEGHVLAKRYLTHAEPDYYDKLSEGSKTTLRFQGGPMSRAEVAARTPRASKMKILAELNSVAGERDKLRAAADEHAATAARFRDEMGLVRREVCFLSS